MLFTKWLTLDDVGFQVVAGDQSGAGKNAVQKQLAYERFALPERFSGMAYDRALVAAADDFRGHPIRKCVPCQPSLASSSH